MPMHTLLTDTIESQGGSALLIKILNRLGVCASADTLSRFIQYKVSTFSKNKLKSLSPDSLTVVSTDNIDFMHSFAQVFCVNQTSSWHGTTVQAIQPLPYLSAHETPDPNPASYANTTALQVGMDLGLSSCPSVIPSPEGTPTEPPSHYRH